MNLNRLNIVLAILCAIAAAFAIAMDVDHTQPNVEFLPEMKRSPAFDAFSANPDLPLERTLQVPVAGTIPRGDLPLYYAATKEDAVRAGEELQNPYLNDPDAQSATKDMPPAASSAQQPDGEAIAADSANSDVAASDPVQPPPDPQATINDSIQRGAEAYGIFCISCHGPTGAGDGPVAKRGFPPPPPLTTGKSVQMKDSQLFHILTYGQGSMSSMAAQLDRNRRWDVINYLRSLQQGAAQLAASPTTPAIDPTTDVADDKSASEAQPEESSPDTTGDKP